MKNVFDLDFEQAYKEYREMHREDKSLTQHEIAQALGLTIRQLRAVITWHHNKALVEDIASKISTGQVNQYIYRPNNRSKKEMDLATAAFVLSEWPNDPFVGGITAIWMEAKKEKVSKEGSKE